MKSRETRAAVVRSAGSQCPRRCYSRRARIEIRLPRQEPNRQEAQGDEREDDQDGDVHRASRSNGQHYAFGPGSWLTMIHRRRRRLRTTARPPRSLGWVVRTHQEPATATERIDARRSSAESGVRGRLPPPHGPRSAIGDSTPSLYGRSATPSCAATTTRWENSTSLNRRSPALLMLAPWIARESQKRTGLRAPKPER